MYLTRIDILELVRSLNATHAVEVGTHLGDYARSILDLTHIERLVCIDPWAGEFYPGQDSEERYAKCQANLAGYGDRVQLLRLTSLEAVDLVEDESQDFVYLDALHRFAGIRADLEVWWPKVKPGGVFAGHDYYTRHNSGVPRAVMEYIGGVQRRNWSITTERHPTWWLRK